MASNVFTPIRGRRMRVTKVDSIGRPEPGLCSTVVTSGFVTVEMTAEIESGEETTVRNAGGDLCISERGCDQLKWINVTVEFCQVDPDLFSMINPTWTKLLDHNGETIGWEESHTYSCDAGFALEVWSDVTGYVPSDPDAQGAFVYYLLPFVVGGTLGDLTIENGAVTFSISGRTKKGSQWGRGPYDVMANPPDGTCGPLITPFNPDSPRRVFLTTCVPPEPVGGCQPLSSADGPQVLLVEDTTDSSRMTVWAVASGAGPFTVDWGDGTVEDLPAGITGLTHQYGVVGTYTVAIYPTGRPSQATYHTVTAPYTGTVPQLPLLMALSEVTADTTRRTVRLDWTNGDQGTVRIEWGDGTNLTAQAVSGNLSHAYATTGQYTVRVIDESDASRKVDQVAIIPFGPVLTTTQDITDPDNRTVNAVVNNSNQGQVTLNWGDGTTTSTNAGNNSAVTKHKYGSGGTFTITVTDSDNVTRTTTKAITVPYLTASVEESDPVGPNRRTVTLTWDNGGQGLVSIDWGDASADDTAQADAGTINHVYAAGGTYTITVTDDTTPTRTDTVQVTVPFV
jgi:hypothetical protein